MRLFGAFNREVRVLKRFKLCYVYPKPSEDVNSIFQSAALCLNYPDGLRITSSTGFCHARLAVCTAVTGIFTSVLEELIGPGRLFGHSGRGSKVSGCHLQSPKVVKHPHMGSSLKFGSFEGSLLKGCRNFIGDLQKGPKFRELPT